MTDEIIVRVTFSESAQDFMAATLDLLEAVETADPALVTDHIVECAGRLRATIDEAEPGEL